MLWGATLRVTAPVRRASARSTSRTRARIPGVRAIVTAEDVPGLLEYGLEHRDQPVFARDVVRYTGEPVAAVAADHPDTARRAVAAIRVEYEPLAPLTDPEAAIERRPIHPDGNLFRHVRIRHGDRRRASARSSSKGIYEVGMQDQAFLGPEAGLASPTDDGAASSCTSRRSGCTSTVTRSPRASALPLERVRLTLAGVGGAFGAPRGRQPAGARLPARVAHRPAGQDDVRPRGVVLRSRASSSCAHVVSPPRRSPDGTLVKVEARILLDGGAYTSSSRAVIANASCFAAGPYRVPNAVIDGYAVRTNNPPCGAMRGFGAVQNCFAHEAQMDKLAAALGIDPVELRLRNALAPGDTLVTGQVITGHRAGGRSDPRAARPRRCRAARRRRRLSRPARWRGTHRRTGRRAARRRLRGRLQEPVVLRRVRRLLDGACAASRTASSRCIARAPKSGRGSSRWPSRSPARCSASTRSCSPRPTPRSARPDRPLPAGRRGCPAVRSGARAATCSPRCVAAASRAMPASIP